MKLWTYLPLLVLAIMGAALRTGASAPPPLRIQPLGDSITFGTGVAGGYREPLQRLLSQAGYTVDFVGTQDGNGSPDLPSARHEGHPGFRIRDLDRLVFGSLDSIPDPDIILLLAGTNDFGRSDEVDTASDRLEALISKLATERPSSQIIVASLIPRAERTGGADRFDQLIRTIFNPRIPAIVHRQVALGRKVSFTDMRSALELSDTSDLVHPNALGYRKMATNWFQAVQRVAGPFGDSSAPRVTRVESLDLETVKVTFAKPVREDSVQAASFRFSNGETQVLGATLDPTHRREVILTTGSQAAFSTQTLEVRGVRDLTPEAHLIAEDSRVTFVARPKAGRGPFRNVAEASEYRVLYAFDIPAGINCCTEAVYDLDLHAGSPGLDRVAYYLELRRPNEPMRFVWASMDVFTNRVESLGLPNAAWGGAFQRTVDRMNVFSNVRGLPDGTNLVGGAIEFWWGDYLPDNGASMVEARSDSYDWGDQFRGDVPSSRSNYGSMQVHYPPAGRVLLAFNGFGGHGGIADVGIGNRPGSLDVDWSLAANAASYVERRMYVLGRPKGPPPPPALLRAVASQDGLRVFLEFDAPLDDSAADPNYFELDRGVRVLDARLDPVTKSHLELRTSPFPADGEVRVGVEGVRDRTAFRTSVSTGISQVIQRPQSPAYDRVPEANGYRLVLDYPIPTAKPPYTDAGVTYQRDFSSLIREPMARVGYYMELARDVGGPTNWIWVSTEAFTTRPRQIGLPVAGGGAQFQQALTNMTVASNVPGIMTGSGISSGQIEFWAWGYDEANAFGVIGASTKAYDWGDKPLPIKDGWFSLGYGSMQIHNVTTSGTPHVLFALNGWGHASRPRLDLGIGNAPGASRDWTLLQNSHEFAVKNLHVFVRTDESTGPIRATLHREGAGWRVRAQATPGRVYRLERSADLLEWTGIGSAEVGDDGDLSLFDATPVPSAAFYRVMD